MEKSVEYHKFLEDLARQISKEKNVINEVSEGTIVDCNEHPCGSAINWKMQYVSLDDWEKIPLKEIAIAIKEGLNMVNFASDFGVKLIKREKFKSLR